MKNYYKFLIKFSLGLVLVISTIFLGFTLVVKAQSNADAIAIRVVPNPHQYTIDEWYAVQNFSGSPQKMIIDGYEAVRDNRTVYVAGTKISGVCNGNPSQVCSSDSDCGNSLISNGLKSRWSFDNQTNVGHDDFGANHGAVTGTTWVGAGRINGALKFNGNNGNSVKVNASPSLNMTTATSFAAWVNLSGYSNSGVARITSRSNYSFELAVGSVSGVGNIPVGNLGIYTGPGGWKNTGYHLGLNQWYQVTATFDGRWRVYVNGNLVWTGVPTTINISSNLIIGSTTSGLEVLNGTIDEVLVYDRALSAAEVQQLNNPSSSTGICNLGSLYFNIYIITFNENADSQTTDIFGKILSVWKFNNNLSDYGYCDYPPQPLTTCAVDADCGGGTTCHNSLCFSPTNEINCLLDSECPSNSFCNSSKAKLLRDVKRLTGLNKIRARLSVYRATNSKYPTLASGSYLPQATISTWPSWQSAFSSEIGLNNVSDPINALGACPGYDAKTCWNATTSKFYANKVASNFELPADSQVMAYTTDVNGSNYQICANMETSYQFMNIDNQSTNLASSSCQTAVSPISGFSGSVNNPPQIITSVLNGIQGQPFTGYIQAIDPDGNPLVFSTNIPSIQNTALNDEKNAKSWWNWLIKPVLALPVNPISLNIWGSWDGAKGPSIYKTNDPNQRKLYSPQAGNAGDYSFVLTVTDSLGASTSATLTVHITSSASPQVNGGNLNFDVSLGTPLDANIYFDAESFGNLLINYSLTDLAKNFNKQNNFWGGLVKAVKPFIRIFSSPIINSAVATTLCDPLVCNYIGANDWFLTSAYVDCSCAKINNNLTARIFKVAPKKYRLNISGVIQPATGNPSQFSKDRELDYGIRITDAQGRQGSDHFSINLKASRPQLTLNCNKKATQFQSYSCAVSNLNSANSLTTYSLTPNNIGLSIALGNANSGLISGIPNQVGDHNMEIIAANEYGATSSIKYVLTVENSCGQTFAYPGGPWNEAGDIRNQGGYYRTVQIGSQCWMQDNLNVPFVSISAINSGLDPALHDIPTLEQSDFFDDAIGARYVAPGSPSRNATGGSSLNQSSGSGPVIIPPSSRSRNNILNRALDGLKNMAKDILPTKKALADLNIINLSMFFPVGDCYNNGGTYCEADGRLYDWREAMNSTSTEAARGLCPSGWHVPADQEFKKLETSLGMCPGVTAVNNTQKIHGFLDIVSNWLKNIRPIKLALAQVIIGEYVQVGGHLNPLGLVPPDYIINSVAPSGNYCVDGYNWRGGNGEGAKLVIDGDAKFDGPFSGGVYAHSTNTKFYLDRTTNGYFWTSSAMASTTPLAYVRAITDNNGNSKIYRDGLYVNHKLPLRCIKDQPCTSVCSVGQSCNPSTGTCCSASCAGKCGGSNGCGGVCPTTHCPIGQICNLSGNCSVSVIFNPVCLPACIGKCGGPDGCSGTCPTTSCSAGQVCNNTTWTCTASDTNLNSQLGD
jgi:hypothetical protein